MSWEKLKLDFCKWVEDQPLVHLPGGPPAVDPVETLYLKHKTLEDHYYKIESQTIPLRFKPLCR